MDSEFKRPTAHTARPAYREKLGSKDPVLAGDTTPEVHRSLLLTTDDLALELRISPVTVKMSRSSSVLLGHSAPPFIKLGRCVRYRRHDIEKWLDDIDH
jgi:hypothetical protein